MANKFYGWLSTFLKDGGLQFTKSGFKGGANMGNHAINGSTGFWEDVNYSGGKPPRWLFQIEVTDGGAVANVPDGLEEIAIGSSNTAQGDKAGLAVRILPLVKTADDAFTSVVDFEINALFLFHGALKAGSSSDGFTLNPATGEMKRMGADEEYIFAALLGLRPRGDETRLNIAGEDCTVAYGMVLDAVQAAIHVRPREQEVQQIPIYDLSDDEEIERLKADVARTVDEAGPPLAPAVGVAAGDDEAEVEAEPLDYAYVDIPENTDLLGVDPAVYRQINAMLKSGKQHIMLYGPPGTGKTSLARWIATNLPGGKWTLITGSSDWSSQDIIGGYQPLGAGDVDFVPGILLREFDHPLIIDELNRCDIDKVIGPLFPTRKP